MVYGLYKRSTSDRVVTPDQTTVAEEVATEINIPTEHTDIAHLRRVHDQPQYLTLISWGAILIGVLGLLLHTVIIMLSLVAVPAVALLTLKVHNRMREKKMANDLRELTSDYAEIVYFAGDSHIDPIRDRLSGDIKIVEGSDARP